MSTYENNCKYPYFKTNHKLFQLIYTKEVYNQHQF